MEQSASQFLPRRRLWRTRRKNSYSLRATGVLGEKQIKRENTGGGAKWENDVISWRHAGRGDVGILWGHMIAKAHNRKLMQAIWSGISPFPDCLASQPSPGLLLI